VAKTFVGIFLAVLIAIPGRSAAPDPTPSGQASFLIGALVADGFLWILSDGGTLSRVSLDDRKISKETTLDPVLGMCGVDGDVEIVSSKPNDPKWVLSRRQAAAWTVKATVETGGDRFMGMACAPAAVTILTQRRLIRISASRQDVVTLSKALSSNGVASVYTTAADVFVGLDAGEWGGGLDRIDRHTGVVTVLQDNASGAICGGPLNPACDPVNAITADPWAPGCVVAAIGLVHFAPHGRIIEVCSDRIKRLYFKPYDWGAQRNRTIGDEPFSTVAFYGVSAGDNVLTAVGIDGLYRIHRDGTAESVPLPHFDDVGGVYVSRNLPGFILVLTDVNRRRSISGSAPMLVSRSGLDDGKKR
jgi:hypothetical protein